MHACLQCVGLSAAGLTALQRLTLTTMACPAHLSQITALTTLQIADLDPFNMVTANQLEVGKGWQGTDITL